MALPETQADRLRCYRNALNNWKIRGYVQFKKRVEEWVLEELEGCSADELRRMLHVFVCNGGKIDEQVERRPEYVSYEYHYDLRLKIGTRRIYVETILHCKDADDPDDPIIVVVNIHDA